MNKYILFFLFLLSLTSISAVQIGNIGEEGVDLIPAVPINYSTVNVNNSDYLDGIDSTGFCQIADGYAKYQFTTNSYNGSGNFTTSNGNIISSLGNSVALTYMTHFFAGNDSQNFSIISGTNAVGTGFKWGTGSRLVATTTRMIYNPDNDWIDILNEQGNKYMATIRLLADIFYINGAEVLRINATGIFTNKTGINIDGNSNITGNFSVSQLIKLDQITLPTCNAVTNGSIGRNNTGVYGCNITGVWSKLF
jgi:hypothetical protein